MHNNQKALDITMEDFVKKSPNFFILGAAKAGTTSLYKLLIQHPDIFLPADKEPRFFSSDDYFNKGVNVYIRNHFNSSQNFIARGDASPPYLSNHEKAAPRIHQAFGVQLRFMIIMRDPVKRAWSHYLHQVRYGVERNSFSNALATENIVPREKRPAWTSYYGDGLYAKQIKGWLNYFPKKNFLFLFTEDLNNDFTKVAQTAFDFLGVNAEFSVAQEHSNVSGRSKYLWLGSMLNRPNYATQAIKHLFPYILRKHIRDAVNRWNKEPFTDPPILDTYIEQELRRKYMQDIVETEMLTGRNLSHWKAC